MLGESASHDREAGIGWRVPDGALDDPVEHHLQTVGAGAPPPGRQYPERSPERLAYTDPASEEKREVRIAIRLKAMAEMAKGSPVAAELNRLADELLDIHL